MRALGYCISCGMTNFLAVSYTLGTTSPPPSRKHTTESMLVETDIGDKEQKLKFPLINFF